MLARVYKRNTCFERGFRLTRVQALDVGLDAVNLSTDAADDGTPCAHTQCRLGKGIGYVTGHLLPYGGDCRWAPDLQVMTGLHPTAHGQLYIQYPIMLALTDHRPEGPSENISTVR